MSQLAWCAVLHILLRHRHARTTCAATRRAIHQTISLIRRERKAKAC